MSSNTPKTSSLFSTLLSLFASIVAIGCFLVLMLFIWPHAPEVQATASQVIADTSLVPATGFGKELHGNIGYIARKGFTGEIAPLYDPGSTNLGAQWDLIKKVAFDVPDPSMLPPITIQVVTREFVLVGTNMVPYLGQGGFRTTLPAGIIVTYPPGSQFR